MAKKKQPKLFTRKGGETAFAYSPADEVRLAYNGWSEVKASEPAAADTEADATADEGSTSTSAGKTPAKSAPKKAS